MSDVSELVVTKLENGLLTVPIHIGQSRPLRFIIDTGATRSAIYKPTAIELSLPIESERTVRIFGMTHNENRPEIVVPRLSFGDYLIQDSMLAVLIQPQEAEVPNKEPIDGILAMDIMKAFRLFYDHTDRTLYLKKNSATPSIIPRDWKQIVLQSNPYQNDGRELKFMDVRMIGPNAPALLDTGSEFNIMNWQVARYPNLRLLKRRLRENWVLSGAIGTFKPRVRTRVDRIRSGQKYWKNQEFLVMDFENLNILGIEDKPFIIAGADLINEESFLLDFQNNILAIAPRKDDFETGFDTKIRSGIRADFFGRVGSRVRKR